MSDEAREDDRPEDKPTDPPAPRRARVVRPREDRDDEGSARPRRRRDDDHDDRPRSRRERDDDYDDDEPRSRRRRQDDDDDYDDRPRRRPRRVEGDDTGGLIPYKNAKALSAYYMAVFSLIPCVGAVLGPLAVVFGFLGLKYAAKHPALKGQAHAYVGIVLGAITTLLNFGGPIVLVVIGAMSKPGR